jgi:hypothetical protein
MATAEPPSRISLPDVSLQRAAKGSSYTMRPANESPTSGARGKSDEDAVRIERSKDETFTGADDRADTSAGAEGNVTDTLAWIR